MSAAEEKMFGKLWFAQPLAERYASLEAPDAGLSIQVEMAKRVSYGDEAVCSTWRGTGEQFSAAKLFSKGVTAKMKTGRWICSGVIRRTIFPDGENRYLYVIEWCNKASLVFSQAVDA